MVQSTRARRAFSGSLILLPLLAVGADFAACPTSAWAEPPARENIAQPASPKATSAAATGKAASGASVKLHDTVVLTLRVSDGARSAAERARSASEALLRALEAEDSSEVRVEKRAGSVVIYAGRISVLELFEKDSGQGALDAYAAAAAARIGDALREEQRRGQIADTVLSISLSVFFGLIAVYVLRRIGEFGRKARELIVSNPERVRGISLQSFEVVGPAALRGGLMAALVVGRFVVQLGAVYAWLVFTLSRFAATRPYTEHLTGFVLTPLSDLAARLAASLPLMLMAFVSGAAVYVLLRFVRLFFASVARGESKLAWPPVDLARPTGALLSVAIVVTALVFAGPLVTGDPEGALARTGSVVLLALGLALTPLLACLSVGAWLVFGRRLPLGQRVELAGRVGRVLELGFLEVRLVADDGSEIRVPHLLSLAHPTRVLGDAGRIAVELCVAPEVSPLEARRVLLQAAQVLDAGARCELIDLDADASRFRVEMSAAAGVSPSDLRLALATALSAAKLALGRSGAGAAPG
jgi:small-conductance mechanosensitive channel